MTDCKTKPFEGKRGTAAWKSWNKARLNNAIEEYNTGCYTQTEIAERHGYSEYTVFCKALHRELRKRMTLNTDVIVDKINRSYELLQEKCLKSAMKGELKPDEAAHRLIEINRDWAKTAGVSKESATQHVYVSSVPSNGPIAEEDEDATEEDKQE